MTNNSRLITNLLDMAALACRAKGMWGVFCSWTPTYGSQDAWRTELRVLAHLPKIDQELFTQEGLPSEGWFLRLIPTDAMAWDYYKECRVGGDDAGIHDGVYAALINFEGNVVTENT